MQKGSGRWNAECRWAWRNLRAQRWHAVLAIVLLATALAANVIVFAATDSLVFRRTLYREPDRLAQIAIRRTPFVNTFASAAVLDQWRQQTLGSSLRLIGVGVALGLAGALAGARWARSQLFAVSPLDPLTLGGVTLVVVATAIVATWQPARQASRTDPRELMKA